MTVEENILAILETTVLTEEERVNKMNSLIEEFRIEHIRKSKGTELSGGERRRVEIARALATDLLLFCWMNLLLESILLLYQISRE